MRIACVRGTDDLVVAFNLAQSAQAADMPRSTPANTGGRGAVAAFLATTPCTPLGRPLDARHGSSRGGVSTAAPQVRLSQPTTLARVDALCACSAFLV
jgi:hypothetical protein